MAIQVVIVALVAGFVMFGCAATPPRRPMYYNCDVTLTNEYGTFTGGAHRVEWHTRLPGEVYVSLEYRVWLKPGPGEPLITFGSLADSPDLVVGWYDIRWQHLSRQRAPRLRSEARIDDFAIRTEFPSPLGHFARSDVHALLMNLGDLELILYDEEGKKLQSVTMPHASLTAVEQNLRDVAVRVRENVADQEHRCKLEEQKEVIGV